MDVMLKQRAKDCIQKYGVFVLAISDYTGQCELCKNGTPHNHQSNTTISDVDAGFIYTIGQTDKHRPEMLVMCGAGLDEDPVTPQQLGEHMMAAHRLINYLIENWDKSPVLLGHTCQDQNGRIYQVVEHRLKGNDQLKEDYTAQTTQYYESMQYEVFVLIPVGWEKKTVN